MCFASAPAIQAQQRHEREARWSRRYADKVWGKFNAQDKEQRLMEAVTANTPVTELPLAMEIDYFRVTPTNYDVPVQRQAVQ
jgi:hypothetical protein